MTFPRQFKEPVAVAVFLHWISHL